LRKIVSSARNGWIPVNQLVVPGSIRPVVGSVMTGTLKYGSRSSRKTPTRKITMNR
jgi:hypothetical protein